MFGYIRPLKCELKVKEYDYYKSVYCGLCHSLRKRCGEIARFVVNYDFVFVALLIALSEKIEDVMVKKRCFVCPKRKLCIESDALDVAADISVILTYFKLRDDISDNRFFAKFFKGILPGFFLKKAYKRAVAARSVFNEKACSLFKELSALENKNVASVDEPADKFAQMVSLIACEAISEQRILKELFYHIGRFVYIIDALDDLETDFNKNEYNPIISAFDISSLSGLDDIKAKVIQTLEDSRCAVLRAFDLLEAGSTSGIIRNIIVLGMPAAIERVNKKKERKRNEESIFSSGNFR